MSEGYRTHTVDVVKGCPGIADEKGDEDDYDVTETDNPDGDYLIKFGYSVPEVLQALDKCKDRVSAHRDLFTRLTGLFSLPAIGLRVDEGLQLSDSVIREEKEGGSWLDECKGSSMIYGDKCRILSPSSVEMDLEVPEALVSTSVSSVWTNGSPTEVVAVSDSKELTD